MKSYYEGETIDLEREFRETGEGKDMNYDFVEIKGKSHDFLLRTPFYQIPCSADENEHRTAKCNSIGENTVEGTCYFIVVRYYATQKSKMSEILAFRELDQSESIKRLKTVIFTVEKPCYHQQFYKGTAKYLAIKPKNNEKYEIFAKKGELIKEGPFYRILGEGPYVYKSKKIVYQFD